MIEHKILTREDVIDYPYKDRPWCKFCSPQVVLQSQGGWYQKTSVRNQWHKNFIKIGEQIVKVIFRNHTIAYFHESCWNDPENKAKVESIIKQASVKS